MRSQQLLVQLLLWVVSAHAFYPYTPSWMEAAQEARSLEHKRASLSLMRRLGSHQVSPLEQANREAEWLTRKYALSQPRSSSLRPRDNRYEVMEPEDPKKDMTAGIAQDGTDFSYFVKVGLGSEGKQVYMLVDSASGTSWVMGPNCTTEACKQHDSFGPDDSKTIEMSDENFSISYGTGKVQGLMAQDDIAVAGVSFKFQIGIADDASEDFEHYAFDGILGLSLGKGQTENFLDVMSADGDLKNNIFSVVLNRASDCDNKGEIVFGSIDDDKYSGEITYTDVISGSDAWAIEVEEVAYDGKKAGIGGIKSFIDTGSTYIYGPKDVVEKIHSVIPNAKSSDGGLSYKIPCDSTKPLTFGFSGVNYEISPKDWISPPNKEEECTSNIYGHDVAAGSLLLGATFVKNVYAVFDKDKERIGFAPLIDAADASECADGEESSRSSSAVAKSSASSSSGEPRSSDTSQTESTSTQITALPDHADRSGKPSLGLAGPEQPSKTKEVEEPDADETDSAACSHVVGSATSMGVVFAMLLTLLV